MQLLRAKLFQEYKGKGPEARIFLVFKARKPIALGSEIKRKRRRKEIKEVTKARLCVL